MTATCCGGYVLLCSNSFNDTSWISTMCFKPCEGGRRCNVIPSILIQWGNVVKREEARGPNYSVNLLIAAYKGCGDIVDGYFAKTLRYSP